MSEIDRLREHIKSLDRELEEIYNKLGFFRRNRSYAEKYNSWEKQAPEE